MKRLLQLLALAGAAAGAVWYARQQAAPEPARPGGTWSGRPRLTAVPDARPERPSEASVPDDLTDIRGIGPVYARQLAAVGITTFAELAAADPVELATEFDPRADVADWVSQARSLTA